MVFDKLCAKVNQNMPKERGFQRFLRCSHAHFYIMMLVQYEDHPAVFGMVLTVFGKMLNRGIDFLVVNQAELLASPQSETSLKDKNKM